MNYSTWDYIGGTIILAAFFAPVALAVLVQALTFLAAVSGHAVEREPSETYLRIKQNPHDLDEDR
jgi:hypothetical protein